MALLTLDAERIAQRRLDVAPCIRLGLHHFAPTAAAQPAGGHAPSGNAAGDTDGIPVSTNGARVSDAAVGAQHAAEGDTLI